MKVLLKKLPIVSVCVICLGSFAKADLAGRIDALIRSQKGVDFSVHIIEADSGRTAYGHNAKEPMIPASNMKIVTSAAALRYLGPDFEYTTRVGLCGDTLVVIGSGDPLLGDEKTNLKYGRENDWIFEDIVERLTDRQIETITDIVVDSSVFDDERVHPSWPKKELNRWYACEVGGLNFNDNCIEVSAENTGREVTLSIEPQTDFVEIVNRVVPISTGASAVGAYRNITPNKITIRGKCRRQTGPFFVAIERPAAFLGFLLAENVARAGINVDGQIVEKTLDDDCDFELLSDYRTAIADCLMRCNKNSLGLAAEALLKTIAAKRNATGKDGSWPDGQKAISQYLMDLGIDEGEFNIDDGGGLSRQNKLSANALTKILSDVYRSNNWELYKNSLAVGGVDGTIAKYFKDKKYAGKIFAKTGYIQGVRSFSGMCCTADGDYLFSILANKINSKTRKVIYDIAQAIVDQADI